MTHRDLISIEWMKQRQNSIVKFFLFRFCWAFHLSLPLQFWIFSLKVVFGMSKRKLLLVEFFKVELSLQITPLTNQRQKGKIVKSQKILCILMIFFFFLVVLILGESTQMPMKIKNKLNVTVMLIKMYQ